MVLFGQDLGGRHEGALIPTLDGGQQRRDGNHCLAGAHVALQEPVHGCGSSQVLQDLGHHPVLGVGKRDAETGPAPLQQNGRGGVVGNPDRGALLVPLALDQGQLEPEQLVEHEAAAGLDHLLHRLWAVDGPVGVRAPDHPVPIEDADRHRVGQAADLPDPTERLAHEPVHVPALEAGRLGLRVDGHDASRPVAHQVHHGVRHLEVTSKAVGLPEHHGLPALGQLLEAPRLVEERQAQPTRVISHPDLDQRTPVAGPTRCHSLHPD